MIEDIAPKLLEEIKAKYSELSKQSATLKDIKKKITNGKATYADMAKYADELGSILAAAYDAALTPDALPDGKMYYNIAKRTVEPTMKSTGRKVTTACETTQTALNKKAKIGIKAQKVQVSQDRIDGIINKVSSADKFKDVSWVLQEPVKTFLRSIVDDSIRANAEFQYSAGMTPIIVRTVTGKCCDWCQEVAGTYKYPDVPKDVYRRHERCRCVVEYLPGNGKRQNVHTKKWADETSQEVLERRKTFGLENPGGSGKIVVHKSLGAAAKKYNARLENSKQHTSLAEGQEITGKVFAGKGTKTKIRDRYRLESDYHIPADEWKKLSGKGYVIESGNKVLAELHWYEAEGEIYEMKIKRYLE